MRQLSLALCALACSGCFVVNDPAQFLGEPVPASEFCDRYAELYCTSALTCTRFGDPDSRCGDPVRAFCDAQFGVILDDPRAAYSAERAGIEFAHGAELARACSADFLSWLTRRDGLSGAFEGTVAAGESCDPRFAETVMFDVPRFFSCRDDGACRAVASGWRCAAPGRVGDPCSPGFAQCDEGLSCGDDGICQDGLAAARGACDEGADCDSQACAVALTIEGVTTVPGHCLTVEEGYEALVRGCATRRIGFLEPGFGPIVASDPPALCPQMLTCFQTLEESEVLGEIARVLERPEPACGEQADPTCPVVCAQELGALDQSEVDYLCILSTLAPPRVQRPLNILCISG